MEKFRRVLVIAIVVVVGIIGLRRCGASGPDVDPKNKYLLSGFEKIGVWGISPERGFHIKLSRWHVTQGKYSLEVKYPKWDLPSINTKRLKSVWGNYENLAITRC